MPPPLPFHRRQRGRTNTTQSSQIEKRSGSHDANLPCDSSNHQSTREVQASQARPLGPCKITEKTVQTSSSRNLMPKIVQTSSFQNLMPTPQAYRTTLLDLARMQQWPAIIYHINRKEAKRCDADGLYPLHWACSGGPPVEAVEALRKAYPKAVRKVDHQGSTVLHFACHYGASTAVIDYLLKAYPRATKEQDKFGRTPLFHAVSKAARFDVIQKLVEADPSAITTACKVPASRASITSAAKQPSQHTPLSLSWVDVLRDPQARLRRSGKKWDKAHYLLQVAYHGSRGINTPNKFRMIPAVISLFSYLPTPVLELAVKACPNELKQIDESTGQLPLAMTASLIHPSRSNYAIQVILDAHSSAAFGVDYKGRSALALALESGKRWDQGVERLFRAAPEALGLFTYLPPVAVAAAATVTDDSSKEQNPAADGREAPKLYITGSLGRKHKDLDWEKSQLRRQPGSDDESRTAKTTDPETQHLSTMYQLLLEDPSIVACATR